MNGPAGWWARALEHQELRDARAPGRTWDLRLLPAALAAWATALLGTRLPLGQAALGGGAVLGLLALLGAVLPPLVHRAVRALHRGPGRAPAVRRSRGAVPWSALGLAALAVAAVLLGTAAERRPLADGALGEALAGGGRFTVTARVLEPPRPWASAGPDAAAAGEDRTGAVVRLRLDEVVQGGRGEAAGVPATVFADGPGWSALTPGARIYAVLEAPPAPCPGALVLRAAAAPSTLPAERPPPGRRCAGASSWPRPGRGPTPRPCSPG
ncbi:hypothetical protein [Kocuria rosea]|uniref:hypothetical protein n=1 Tax=Kocuria rosea TaxID=1275 RepID=UPI00203DFED2|nr:hypothetical protein [Kocuria rosea]MCM3687434.1 hypothetical protein [Kocuria rosea]